MPNKTSVQGDTTTVLPIHHPPQPMEQMGNGAANASVIPTTNGNHNGTANSPQRPQKHTDRQRRRDPVTRKEAMPPPPRRPGKRPGSASAAERRRESARCALHDENGKGGHEGADWGWRASWSTWIAAITSPDPRRARRGSKAVHVYCVNAPTAPPMMPTPPSQSTEDGPTAEWLDPILWPVGGRPPAVGRC